MHLRKFEIKTSKYKMSYFWEDLEGYCHHSHFRCRDESSPSRLCCGKVTARGTRAAASKCRIAGSEVRSRSGFLEQRIVQKWLCSEKPKHFRHWSWNESLLIEVWKLIVLSLYTSIYYYWRINFFIDCFLHGALWNLHLFCSPFLLQTTAWSAWFSKSDSQPLSYVHLFNSLSYLDDLFGTIDPTDQQMLRIRKPALLCFIFVHAASRKRCGTFALSCLRGHQTPGVRCFHLGCLEVSWV